MKRILSILFAGYLLIGCSPSPKTEPMRADYEKINRVLLSKSDMCCWETSAIDIDGDGLVDCISSEGTGVNNYFFARGYKEKCLGIRNFSKEMSEELRDSASRLLKAKKDLEYETDRINFFKK
jgi:hypothetical protein